MATLKQINAAIQKTEPLVTLFRENGYHYYEFDNVADESTLTTPVYKAGDRMVHDTESVMVCYLNQQSKDDWVQDGIAYGKRIRSRFDLPEVTV